MVCLRAADDPDIETGTFTLFKFEQAIGEERYEIRPGPGGFDGFTLTSKFSFTDRGTTVPLDATLQFDRDRAPVHFLIHGDTARLSTIDAEVTLAGGMATIREGSASRREPRAGRCLHAGRLRAAVGADGVDAVLGGARTAGIGRCFRTAPRALSRVAATR